MERLSSTLFVLFRGTPRHADWIVACLEGAWSALLGTTIAAACAPLGWHDRRLTIVVKDPAWRAPLEAMRGELLKRIRSAAGDEVREIELRTEMAPPERQA